MNKNDLILFNNFTDGLIEKLLTGKYQGICEAHERNYMDYKGLTVSSAYLIGNYTRILKDFLSVPHARSFWWKAIQSDPSIEGYSTNVRIYAMELFRNHIKESINEQK